MKNLSVLVLLTAMVGCGALPSIPFIGDSDKPEKQTYVDLRPQPTLQIPEDLKQSELGQVSAVPEISLQRNASFYPDRPPLPDAKYATDNRNEVRMQRLGDRNWLVIPEAPTTATKMKQFFADNGIVLADDRPEFGRLNTAWLTDSGRPARDVVRTLLQSARRDAGLEVGDDRFLIRVEQGLQPQSTEVHIRHDNDALGEDIPAADLVRVQEVNSDLLAAEKGLLEQIGGYVAARVAESTVSKVALQIGSQPKTDMQRNSDGIPELSFFLDKKRTVASLTQSLRNAGVILNAEDADAGRFISAFQARF